MGRWWRWSPVIVALAILAIAADADAQRRGRGRRGRRGATADTEATAGTGGDAAPTDPTAPPPDPYAAGGASTGASGATSGTGSSGAASAPTSSAAGTATATASTGASASASTAAPAAPTAAAPDPRPTPPDLAPLRQEYVAIMDEMVQARSRVAVIGQELFQTRMTVQVQDRTGDEASLARFVLELDGTPIYDSEGEIEGGAEGRQLFEGALAPGPHVLTLEMEQRARDDPEYRVTQRESFRFVVVRERLTEVTIVLEDDSDIARSFPSGGEGHFEVRTRVRVATRALPRS